MSLDHLPWGRVEPVRKDKATDWADLIERLAAGFERQVAEAFIAAAAQLGTRADVKALAEAIQRGDAEAVADLLGLAADGSAFAGVLPALQQAAVQGGTAAIASVIGPAGTVARVSFDLFNPYTARFLREYGFRLIKQITEEVRAGIAVAVRRGVEAGKNPNVTAVEVRKVAGFGLTAQQAQAVANYRAELEARERGALKRALRDKRFDKTVKAAVEGAKGLSAEQIDKMVERYRQKLLKHRATVIARTESLRAANMGAHLAIVQAVENGSVPDGAFVRRWIIAKDERTCKTCRAIPRLNPRGVGLKQAFTTPLGPVLLPPAHPSCRCTIVHRIRPQAIAAADVPPAPRPGGPDARSPVL